MRRCLSRCSPIVKVLIQADTALANQFGLQVGVVIPLDRHTGGI